MTKQIDTEARYAELIAEYVAQGKTRAAAKMAAHRQVVDELAKAWRAADPAER